MASIHYTLGDATQPGSPGPAIIVHICNDIGGWGAGFVLALSKRWPEPERCYRAWHQSGSAAEDAPFELGQVQFVEVGNDITVANLIGQRGIRKVGRQPPIRYEAVESGLAKIAVRSLATNASVHMPRIGCGLAGGRWEEIEPLIVSQLIEKGVDVTVYDFNASSL